MTARIRLWSGVVLFVYAASHLINHALLLGSVGLANEGLVVFTAVWRGLPGTVVLYGAFAAHFALALWSVFRRRRLRMPVIEWIQLALGVSILPVGMAHFVATRGAAELHDVNTTYVWVLLSALSWTGLVQLFALVLIVWIHGCVGLHRIGRLKPWYGPASPWLLAAAVALPTLALAGAGVGLREVAAMVADPEIARRLPGDLRVGPGLAEKIYALSDALKLAALSLLTATLAARPLRDLWNRRNGVVRVSYDSRVASAPAGPTLLEISRSAGIPHASVCGGRGRCSTCRARIAGPDIARLAPPDAAEAKVLARVGAGDGVRLACQVRPPPGEYLVTPLVAPTAGPAEAWRRPSAQGRERVVAVLFADIRGFTTLAEGRLPYDVVFVINRYFRAMGAAVEAAGGHVDKFVGDGVMALFGLDGEPPDAARRALDAARRMSLALIELNRALRVDLDIELRIGIGIHAGNAIVGEMGYGRASSVTAIGDMVNTASRLEAMTKELACELVVSQSVVELAGASLDGALRHEIDVRGRRGRLEIHALASASTLAAPA
ncbi:MAG: adenylate/guanylate cyclase domain-containing protein [Rhodospirillales bacterium]|nr:MAG: adenylate/guanylate cyclase domain-containing protein [Rhodospirillales bacterium]